MNKNPDEIQKSMWDTVWITLVSGMLVITGAIEMVDFLNRHSPGGDA